MFDAVDTLLLVLPAMAGLVATMRVNTATAGGARRRDGLRARHRPRRAAGPAGRAVPRGARGRSAPGRVVPGATTRTCDDLTDEELAKVSPHLTPDVREVLTVRRRARRPQGLRRHRAGPGPRAARRAARDRSTRRPPGPRG